MEETNIGANIGQSEMIPATNIELERQLRIQENQRRLQELGIATAARQMKQVAFDRGRRPTTQKEAGACSSLQHTVNIHPPRRSKRQAEKWTEVRTVRDQWDRHSVT